MQDTTHGDRRQKLADKPRSPPPTFIRDLAEQLACSQEDARTAAIAVLSALVQRILDNEIRALEAQLPIKLREVLESCVREGELLPRDLGKRELVEIAAAHLGKEPESAEPLVLGVMTTLCRHGAPGEIHEVLAQLPWHSCPVNGQTCSTPGVRRPRPVSGSAVRR